MPTTSSAKKTSTEASSSKKATDVTPLRISSRVRKEKFSVKELFGTGKDKDVSSDEEPSKPTPKKRIIEKTPASTSKTSNDKNTKVQVVKLDSNKGTTSKTTGKLQLEYSTKPGPSKTSILSKSGVAGPSKSSSVSSKPIPSTKPNSNTPSKLSSSKLALHTSNTKAISVTKSLMASVKPSISPSHKPSILQPNRSSLVKKQHDVSSTSPTTSKDDIEAKVSSPKAKTSSQSREEDKLDLIKFDSIKVEPIFNEDNIDTVLENPSSLGLDIVVTKLSESDQKENAESKKSKNVVTIAKVTGSTTASKPIKVVPLKPSDKIVDLDVSIEECKILSKSLDFKGSGVVITPKIDKSSKSSSHNADKKSKAPMQPFGSGKVQIKEVKVNKSPGSEVVVVTQSIDNKGSVSSKIVEKKKEHKSESNHAKTKQNLIDIELEKCRDQLEISFVKTKDIQRQKAIKRSIMDVMSDVTSNGHKSLKVRSAEADSSSNETDIKRSRIIDDVIADDEETCQGGLVKAPFEFDRYFSTSESLIEHNESLDSDASLEDSETYLSHFYEKGSYNNNSRKRKLNDPYSDDYTIYDLMYEVNCEFPSWNLHVMQDTASFLICQVTRDSTGFPIISKMIELESDFSSAKVFVNQTLHREFNGTYNTCDSIKELITSVQHL